MYTYSRQTLPRAESTISKIHLLRYVRLDRLSDDVVREREAWVTTLAPCAVILDVTVVDERTVWYGIEHLAVSLASVHENNIGGMNAILYGPVLAKDVYECRVLCRLPKMYGAVDVKLGVVALREPRHLESRRQKTICILVRCMPDDGAELQRLKCIEVRQSPL